MRGSIKGSIHSFLGATGASIGAWTVFLDGAAKTDTDDNNRQVRDAATIGDTGNIIDAGTGGHADGVEWCGSWSAQFYGGAPTADNTAGTLLPDGVAGTFNAATPDTGGPPMTTDHQGPNIAVTGAFGARQEDDDS